MDQTEDLGRVLGVEDLHGAPVQAVAVAAAAKIRSSTTEFSLEAGVVGRQMEVVELCQTWGQLAREEVSSPHPSVVIFLLLILFLKCRWLMQLNSPMLTHLKRRKSMWLHHLYLNSMSGWWRGMVSYKNRILCTKRVPKLLNVLI